MGGYNSIVQLTGLTGQTLVMDGKFFLLPLPYHISFVLLSHLDSSHFFSFLFFSFFSFLFFFFFSYWLVLEKFGKKRRRFVVVLLVCERLKTKLLCGRETVAMKQKQCAWGKQGNFYFTKC